MSADSLSIISKKDEEDVKRKTEGSNLFKKQISNMIPEKIVKPKPSRQGDKTPSYEKRAMKTISDNVVKKHMKEEGNSPRSKNHSPGDKGENTETIVSDNHVLKNSTLGNHEIYKNNHQSRGTNSSPSREVEYIENTPLDNNDNTSRGNRFDQLPMGLSNYTDLNGLN